MSLLSLLTFRPYGGEFFKLFEEIKRYSDSDAHIEHSSTNLFNAVFFFFFNDPVNSSSFFFFSSAVSEACGTRARDRILATAGAVPDP